MTGEDHLNDRHVSLQQRLHRQIDDLEQQLWLAEHRATCAERAAIRLAVQPSAPSWVKLIFWYLARHQLVPELYLMALVAMIGWAMALLG